MTTSGGGLRALLPTLLTAALLSGCGVQIPTDPNGTLERVQASGELRVGVSPHPPFTTLPPEPDSDPGGTEVTLMEDFASSLGAEAVYAVGGEEELVRRLEEGQLDVLIGGLTSKSPWSTKVGLTRPYLETPEGGEQVKHVMAVVRGENAFMSELERFLDGEGS
jgi:ABC-type amino acid transport substrate-binding protein